MVDPYIIISKDGSMRGTAHRSMSEVKCKVEGCYSINYLITWENGKHETFCGHELSWINGSIGEVI